MREPLALLDELERVLGIGAFPVNWPIGTGFEFQGRVRSPGEAGASLRAHRRRAVPRAGVGGRLARSDHPRAARRRDLSTRSRGTGDARTRPGEAFDDDAVLAGQDHAGLFRQRHQQFRRAAAARRISETCAAAQSRASMAGIGPDRTRSIRRSPVSSSKSRRTWTRGTATASPSCAFAPANSSAT